MLRVAPDGRYLWVQTVGAQTNVVLDAETMEAVRTTPTGQGPVQSAFPPNVVAALNTFDWFAATACGSVTPRSTT